jgi:hypothetical protein
MEVLEIGQMDREWSLIGKRKRQRGRAEIDREGDRQNE